MGEEERAEEGERREGEGEGREGAHRRRSAVMCVDEAAKE